MEYFLNTITIQFVFTWQNELLLADVFEKAIYDIVDMLFINQFGYRTIEPVVFIISQELFLFLEIELIL